MKPLPPWNTVIAVHVKRQGGIAAIPAQARPRTIAVQDCADDERGRLCAAVTQAAAYASDGCGMGDQRYFTVEISREGDGDPLRFNVPEDAAPEPLVTLWRDGKA